MSTWDQELAFTEVVSGGTSGAEFHKIAALWALRILVRLGGYKRFPQAVMDEAEVLTAVGVKTAQGSESVTATELKRQFSLRLAKVEQRPAARIGALGRNLKLLAKSLSLSGADCKVLAFAVVVHNVGWLESVAETLGRLDRRGTVAAIAKVLGMSIDEVRHTLDPGGILANTSILRVSTQAGDLKSKLELLDGFTGVLTQPHRNATELLRPFFRYPPAAKLQRSDYIHARAEWSLISEYLRAALDDKHAGVNILGHRGFVWVKLEPGSRRRPYFRRV